MKEEEDVRYIPNRPGVIILAALSLASVAQAQESSVSGAQVPDKPSNGVFRLSAHQVPRHHLHERDIPPPLPDGSPAWEGIIEIDITNIDTGPVSLNNHGAGWSYMFEVFDSAGQPVPMTVYGARVAAVRAPHPASAAQAWPPAGPRGGETVLLNPMESAHEGMDLSLLFDIKTGYEYTVRIKRILDRNTRNYAGKLLSADELELTYTLRIPGRSVEGKN